MRPAQLILLLALLLAPTGVRADVVVHTVEPDRRFQTIDHFGASDCWTTKILGHWSAASRERVADLLFSREKGIGLSLWRFNLGAGLQPDRIKDPLRTTESFEVAKGKYDWTRMQAERAMLLAAKRRGVSRFHAFSLSGTPRMTRNGFVNADPGPHSTNLRADATGDYAVYLADVMQQFARGYPPAERVVFDWISPVNEPQWDWNGGSHAGTRASNADIKRIALPLARELSRRKLSTRVHLAESGSLPDMSQANSAACNRYNTPFGDYVDALCGDSELAPVLGKTIGFHSYWSDGGAVFWKHRIALRKKLDEYPDWQAFQTEYCVMKWGRDLGMDTALHVARVMHGDLSAVNVAGWSWWLAFSPHDYKDGLIYTDWKKPGDPESILPSKTLWALGAYSRFVRPGMVRVGIRGPGLHDYANLVATAYRDPKSKRVVVVYVNSGATAHTVRIRVIGGRSSADIVAAYLTSGHAADDLRVVPQSDKRAPVTIPPRSVMTVVLAE